MAADLVSLKELAAFVNALQKRGGYKTTADFARDASFPAPNLSNIRNGKAGVDGVNLLKLIRAAAYRAGENEVSFALQAAEPAVDLREVVVRLEAVVVRLTGLLDDPPNAQGHGRGP